MSDVTKMTWLPTEHPSPKRADFKSWGDWTLALATWVLERDDVGDMSAGRLACVFNVVEFESKKEADAARSQPGVAVPDGKRIAEIRERESKATKGPWLFESQGDPQIEVLISGDVSDEEYEARHAPVLLHGHELGGAEIEANWEFIQHARADIPFLLEQLTAVAVPDAEHEKLLDAYADAVQPAFSRPKDAGDTSELRARILSLMGRDCGQWIACDCCAIDPNCSICGGTGISKPKEGTKERK